jgi:hypothetical protein
MKSKNWITISLYELKLFGSGIIKNNNESPSLSYTVNYIAVKFFENGLNFIQVRITIMTKKNKDTWWFTTTNYFELTEQFFSSLN